MVMKSAATRNSPNAGSPGLEQKPDCLTLGTAYMVRRNLTTNHANRTRHEEFTAQNTKNTENADSFAHANLWLRTFGSTQFAG
jgi:hypothetical protein